MKDIILIFGTFNSGKTLVYNLFKDLDSFKHFEIMIAHLPLYRNEMVEQIGHQDYKKFMKQVRSRQLKKYGPLRDWLKVTSKRFDESNLIVKGVDASILTRGQINIKNKNIRNFYVFRDPRTSWLTFSHYNPVKSFIDTYIDTCRSMQPLIENNTIEVVRVEDVSRINIFKKHIDSRILREVKSITDFDLIGINELDFSTALDQANYIEKELKEVIEILGYPLGNIEYNKRIIEELRELKEKR